MPSQLVLSTGGTPWHTDNAEWRQTYGTPMPLFREIERQHGGGGFTLDVCAEPWSAKCPRYFTRENDALAQAWGNALDRAVCWCNPPYDDIGAWIEKGWAEVERGNAERVVYLVPSRTDQVWWRFARQRAVLIEDIVGRVAFETQDEDGPRAEGGAFEASVIIVFRQPIVAADFRSATRRRAAPGRTA